MKGRIQKPSADGAAFFVFGKLRVTRKLSEEFAERQRLEIEWSVERFTPNTLLGTFILCLFDIIQLITSWQKIMEIGQER
jgi:hypothetical protein